MSRARSLIQALQGAVCAGSIGMRALGARTFDVLTSEARTLGMRIKKAQASAALAFDAVVMRAPSLGALAFGAFAIGVLAPQMAAAEPIVVKFSHVVAPDTPKGKAALKFKELAALYTQGEVEVQVYPNGSLYHDKEELEALQLGAVQMLAPSLAKFGGLGLPQFELFDLPFLMADEAALRLITEGPVGQELLTLLDQRGITGLAYWDNGFKIMSGPVPMHHPADFKGLKMRIQASRSLEAQMLALGARPVILGFSDLYQAIQTGLVDGAENPPSNMFTQRIHEVQAHATISRHGYLGYAVIVNKAFWDSLPDDIREALEQAMQEATVYGNSIALAENRAALAAMQAAGTTTFYTLTPQERAEWVTILRPVHQAMAPRIGADLLAQAYEALGLDP